MPPVSGEQRERVTLQKRHQETQKHNKQQPLTRKTSMYAAMMKKMMQKTFLLLSHKSLFKGRGHNSWVNTVFCQNFCNILINRLNQAKCLLLCDNEQ